MSRGSVRGDEVEEPTRQVPRAYRAAMNEWIPVAAGVVSGAVSGWAAAWIGRPAAAAAAEEAKERTDERRAIVRAGRELVQGAYAMNESPATVAGDSRYIAIRRHLSPEVQAVYRVQVQPTTPGALMLNLRGAGAPKYSHEALQADIERLDREWNLS